MYSYRHAYLSYIELGPPSRDIFISFLHDRLLVLFLLGFLRAGHPSASRRPSAERALHSVLALSATLADHQYDDECAYTCYIWRLCFLLACQRSGGFPIFSQLFQTTFSLNNILQLFLYCADGLFTQATHSINTRSTTYHAYTTSHPRAQGGPTAPPLDRSCLSAIGRPFFQLSLPKSST